MVWEQWKSICEICIELIINVTCKLLYLFSENIGCMIEEISGIYAEFGLNFKELSKFYGWLKFCRNCKGTVQGIFFFTQ